MTQNASSHSIRLDDLPGAWRVDVERCWIGASMAPSFGARLLVKDDKSRRWQRLGKIVLSDDGPIQAISDLLSALDMGVLE
jgi:hypothetical protein